MTPPTHPVASYLLFAEFGAALFGSTAGSTEERITQEIIDAVRMAGPEAVRPAEAVPVGIEAVPPREAKAERSTEGMAARHN